MTIPTIGAPATPTDALPAWPAEVDAAPSGATPAGATPVDAGTGDPPGGVAATADAGVGAARQAADRALIAALFDEVAGHLATAADSDPVAGTSSRSREVMISLLQRVFDASPSVVVADPVAGTSTDVSATVRGALGLGPTEPVPGDAATVLLRRITGLDDPYQVASALRWMDALPAEQSTGLFSADPDSADPTVLETLAALEAAEPGTRTSEPDISEGVSGAVKLALGKAYRAQLRARRAFFRRVLPPRAGTADPVTLSLDGQLAHQVITLHYLVEHPGHSVIVDTLAHLPGAGTLVTLASAAASSGPFAAARAGLVSSITGRVGQPDILDLQTRECYEIKPIGQIYGGAAQLVGRYLFFLNISVLGGEQAARALIAALLPGGGTADWSPPTQDVRPFLPGTSWRPSRFYPLPDGRLMAAELVSAGVICYQIFRVRGRGKVLTAEERALLREFLFSALVAVAAGESAAVEPATPDGVLPALGRGLGTVPDLVGLEKLARLVGEELSVALAAVATVQLVIELVPLLEGLSVVLLAALL